MSMCQTPGQSRHWYVSIGSNTSYAIDLPVTRPSDTKCVFDDNQRHGPRHDSLTTSLTEAFATHRAGLDGTIQKHLHPLVKKIENLEIKLEAAMQLLLKRSSGHHDGKVEREQEGNNNHIV